MKNFLKETIEDIEKSGHTIKDIVFIGSQESGHSCTWDEFCLLADREYDNWYGHSEVADDLIIVFKDGMKMWRREYDGFEWWEYSKPFIMPEVKLKITRLICEEEVGWRSLNELNSTEE